MASDNPFEYYSDEEQYGNYVYVTLENIVYGFMQGFTGKNTVLGDIERSAVLYWAKKGLQQFNYEALKEVKAVELELGDTLDIILPPDYVEYVRVSWVHPVTGALMPMSRNDKLPLATAYLQDHLANILFDNDGQILEGTTIFQELNDHPTNPQTNSLSILEEEGLYMKIKQGNFDITITDESFQTFSGTGKRRYATRSFVSTTPDFGIYNGGTFEPIPVNAGSVIRFYVNIKAFGNIAFDHVCEIIVTAQEDYASVREWWEAEIEILTQWTTFNNDYLRDYQWGTDDKSDIGGAIKDVMTQSVAGGTVGKIANALQIGARTSKIGNLMEPGSHTETIKHYTPSDGESYKVTFTLSNTLLFSDIQRNWELCFVLNYQNRANRRSVSLLDPPVIYSISIPGVNQFLYAFINNLEISNMGTSRYVDLDIGRKLIPEAYQISFEIKSLLTPTQNLLLYAHTGSKVESGVT